MNGYKLPRCWVGKETTVPTIGEDGQLHLTPKVVGEIDCNPDCHCLHPMQAHFCMEGHMTECHAGMTCEQAQCSHWRDREDYV